MREKGIDTWDGAQTHMVLLGECFGTVQVGCRCTVHCCRGEGYLAGKLVKGQFEIVPECGFLINGASM
nr:hypothetical protein [Tanacetum cinerariifolium]